MYSPVKDGIEKAVEHVRFTEAKPPESLKELVHGYWELRTEETLAEAFQYLIVPDACVNILFNQRNLDIAAVTSGPASTMALDLGKDFHYVGIQLLPGVWRGPPSELCRKLVDQPYLGRLPLVETNRRLASLPFQQQHSILTALVDHLARSGFILRHPVISKLLEKISDIRQVEDMARLTGLSARQLQRMLKETIGFSPHDFLKILRVQYSFCGDFLSHFTDQAHYIHSFRRATGHTPMGFKKRFHS